MKKIIQSFINYSTLEKRGIVALVFIIFLLLASLFTMPYWLKNTTSISEDSTLVAAWEAFKLSHTPTPDTATVGLVATSSRFSFDPNTLDSIGFINLGLTTKQVRLLLHWRRKGKVFYKKEDFSKLYTLTAIQYEQLAPYIQIASSQTVSRFENRWETLPEPQQVDINTVDSVTLIRLKGIGPYFAHKLLERRDKLGGYIKHEQLLEAYKFSDSTYQLLKKKMVINSNAIRKINLNIATEAQLSNHPYINAKLANHIILYRENLKQFEKIEQLRQVPLMNEEIYRKIAPYLSIE